MVRFFFIIIFSTSFVHANDWYDVYNLCTKRNEIEQIKEFQKIAKLIPQGMERLNSKTDEMWLEKVPTKDGETLKVMRATIGQFKSSHSECKKASLGKISITGLDKLPKDKKWWRAYTHKHSCQLAPVSLEDIKTWVGVDLAYKFMKSSCVLESTTGPNGILLSTSCGGESFAYTDSLKGCDWMVNFQKDNIPDNLLKQFGY